MPKKFVEVRLNTAPLPIKPTTIFPEKLLFAAELAVTNFKAELGSNPIDKLLE